MAATTPETAHIRGTRARIFVAALALSTALPTLPLRAEPVTISGTTPAPAYTASQAQDAATLIADRVTVTGSDTLVAEGNVEVYYKQNVLTAKKVTYDKASDKLYIEGPLRLSQPGEAGTVAIGDGAELSRDLQNGIMTGARMVLARELQIAANQIRRDGTKTVATHVVASSCQVCASDPTPLWEIRSHTFDHDQQTHLMHFTNAQFRLMGYPVMWLPTLTMPDATVQRMSGVLRPTFRTTSNLGAGLKVPYFITLGRSADLTVTPYLSSSYTRTLGLAYRQALTNGNFSIEGSLSRDSIIPGTTRGYLFANGEFKLPAGYNLGLQLRMVSDPSYLVDYDVTDADRLWSGAWLEKIKPDELIWLRVGHTHTIRAGESNSSEPMTSADFTWEHVIHPARIGGEATVTWEVHAHERASDLSFDNNADGVSDGRDMMRTTFSADWRRNWMLPGGVVAAGIGNLSLDGYLVRQDDAYRGEYLNATPTVGVELRWPWVAQSQSASYVLEPIAQFLVSPNDVRKLPNEDSLLTEFDEGNLWDLSRYSGGDAREQGARANLGFSWTRLDAAGWAMGFTAGRVIRSKNLDQFGEATGLGGSKSDWLVATTLTTSNGLTIGNRALFDDSFNFAREEIRFGYEQSGYKIAAGYIWLQKDASESIPDGVSELQFDSSWPIHNGWSGKFLTRYDFISDRAARAGIGLEYASDCVTLDLSLSRRYTSSTTVTPETAFSFSVQLAGFGGTTTASKAQQVCRG